MATHDFSITLLVDQTPEKVFASVNNIRGWWIDAIEGNADQLHDEFAVRFADVHYSKQRVVEFIPGIKVVWMVTASKLNFLKQKDEWTGTKISFEISRQDNKTKLRFTHNGLVPSSECYKDCSPAWTEYIQDSLHGLITTGKGLPFKINAKEKV